MNVDDTVLLKGTHVDGTHQVKVDVDGKEIELTSIGRPHEGKIRLKCVCINDDDGKIHLEDSRGQIISVDRQRCMDEKDSHGNEFIEIEDNGKKVIKKKGGAAKVSLSAAKRSSKEIQTFSLRFQDVHEISISLSGRESGASGHVMWRKRNDPYVDATQVSESGGYSSVLADVRDNGGTIKIELDWDNNTISLLSKDNMVLAVWKDLRSDFDKYNFWSSRPIMIRFGESGGTVELIKWTDKREREIAAINEGSPNDDVGGLLSRFVGLAQPHRKVHTPGGLLQGSIIPESESQPQAGGKKKDATPTDEHEPVQNTTCRETLIHED